MRFVLVLPFLLLAACPGKFVSHETLDILKGQVDFEAHILAEDPCEGRTAKAFRRCQRLEVILQHRHESDRLVLCDVGFEEYCGVR